MALSTEAKNEKVWEWFNNNADTSLGKKYFEETVPRASEVHGSEVFGQVIPQTPPATTSEVVKKYWGSEDGGDDWIEMTVDRSVGGNKTWVALPSHNDNWSSGSADTAEILSGFISPKYGKKYLVKIFDGNDDEIPQLDTSDWTFDYSAGLLVFNSENRTETGGTPQDSIKIKVYRYIGRNVLEIINNASGRLILRGDLIGDRDGLNKNFTLPVAIDSGVYYEIRVSGIPLSFGDYEIVNGTSIRLIAAPEETQGTDIVYYPSS